MAKASRPGNQAVAGIAPAVTDEERYPNYVPPNTVKSSSQTGAGSSSSRSSSAKNTGSASVKSTSSSAAKTGSSTGSNALYGAMPEE